MPDTMAPRNIQQYPGNAPSHFPLLYDRGRVTSDSILPHLRTLVLPLMHPTISQLIPSLETFQIYTPFPPPLLTTPHPATMTGTTRAMLLSLRFLHVAALPQAR